VQKFTQTESQAPMLARAVAGFDEYTTFFLPQPLSPRCGPGPLRTAFFEVLDDEENAAALKSIAMERWNGAPGRRPLGPPMRDLGDSDGREAGPVGVMPFFTRTDTPGRGFPPHGCRVFFRKLVSVEWGKRGKARLSSAAWLPFS